MMATMQQHGQIAERALERFRRALEGGADGGGQDAIGGGLYFVRDHVA